MKTTLKELQDLVTVVTVELSAEELLGHMKAAEAMAAQDLEVDGFRKGKVPQHLVKDHLDQERLREAALQFAIEKSLAHTIKEKELEVASVSDLKVVENTPEKLVYTVHLSLFPKIELPTLGDIKVEKSAALEVTDTEMQEALSTIQRSRATFHDKEGPAADGDRVEIDFEVRKDGTIIEGGESKNHPVVIGAKGFIPGFEEQLVGMKAGESKEFSLEALADYFHKEIAGKKLDFKVVVHRVQSVKLPTLDDAFAQALGKFDGLDALRQNIKNGMQQEKNAAAQQKVRLAILEVISSKVTVSLPETLVHDRLDSMVAGFDQDLHARGMELGMYLAHLGKTQEQLRNDWRKDAERQVKIELVIHEIARKNNLSVAPDEVEEAFQTTLQGALARGELNVEKVDMQGLRRSITDRILNEKTLTFLETQCVA